MALIGINIAVFLYEWWLESQGLMNLRIFEARYALSLEGLQEGHFWKLASFQFLHAGLLHLLLNCWSIFVFGPPLEAVLGKSRFATLYFVSGIAGGALQVAASVFAYQRFGGPVVGASAGVFGLVAAFTSLFPETRMTLLLFFVIPVRMTANRMLTVAAVITALGIMVPNWVLGARVAHAAHLGGLLAGLIMVRLFLRRFRH